MTEYPVNLLRYGSLEDLPEQYDLRAGPLTARYVDGDLRTIRLGEYEVLRRVYVAVRDQNWNTIPATLSDVTIEQEQDAFEIRYSALHKQDEICFRWEATIRGTSNGEIVFSMDGEACRSFLRNRIGLCVLHPMADCAGKACRVTHADGHVTRGHFPLYIAPHQPFKAMRAIAHQVTPGAWAEVEFEGDLFEMEDQRNWTDASYKTYSTPLELPFPVRMEQGTPVRQSVRLSLQGNTPLSAKPRAEGITLSLGGVMRQTRPPLGLSVAPESQPLSEQAVARLRALNLAHLRVGLDAHQPLETLRHVAEQARRLGVGLEIGLPLAALDRAALVQVGEALAASGVPVVRWLLFTDGLDSLLAAEAVTVVRQALEANAPQALLAVGTDAYFTELNRNRPPLTQADLLCYSLNPQVHAFDNLSLVETLPAQGVTVASARRFAQGRPVVVSPITLRPRYNLSATAPEAARPAGKLTANADPRQMSLLGAAWTLISLKHLMRQADLDSLTYYETVGVRGAMAAQTETLPPAAFASLPGAVYPLYHVLRWAGACGPAAIRSLHSTKPLCANGLALQSGDRLSIGLANLTHTAQYVTLTGLERTMRAVVLDETTVAAAMQHPDTFAQNQGATCAPSRGRLTLDLLPYAVAWLQEIE